MGQCEKGVARAFARVEELLMRKFDSLANLQRLVRAKVIEPFKVRDRQPFPETCNFGQRVSSFDNVIGVVGGIFGVIYS